MSGVDLISQIPLWKAKYGRLIRVSLNEVEFIFRPLTLREWDLLYKEETKQEQGGGLFPTPLFLAFQEQWLSATLLHPAGFDFDDLSNSDFQKLYSSLIKGAKWGGDNLYDLYSKRSEEVGEGLEFVFGAKVLMCRAFPGINPDIIDSWSADQFIENLLVAERVMNVNLVTGKEIISTQSVKDKLAPPPSPEEIHAMRRPQSRKQEVPWKYPDPPSLDDVHWDKPPSTLEEMQQQNAEFERNMRGE